MDAMSIAPEIEASMKEPVERLSKLAETTSGISVINSGVVEAGPHLFSYGLCCESSRAQTSDVTFLFGCHAIRAPSASFPLFQISTGWHRSMTNMENNSHPGFTLYELHPKGSTCKMPEQAEVLRSWIPKFESAMRQAIVRGHPPQGFVDSLKRLLHLLTPVQHY